MFQSFMNKEKIHYEGVQFVRSQRFIYILTYTVMDQKLW